MADFKPLTTLLTLLCLCSLCGCENVLDGAAASGPRNGTSLSELLSAAAGYDLDSLFQNIESQYSSSGNSSSVSSRTRGAGNEQVTRIKPVSSCGLLLSSCNKEVLRTVNLVRRQFHKSQVQLMDAVPRTLWHSFDFFQKTPTEFKRIAGAGETETESYRRKLKPSVTIPAKIHQAGYPAEIHQIQTEDGYILTYHRIPHGRNDGDCGANAEVDKRKPILLHHGMFGHAGFWLSQDPSKNLPYQLADMGFDIWLANCRGTNVSQAHISLDPSSSKFWDYSYDEIGRYDLPAAIDYILEVTGSPNLIYIGHSMGTTAFFVGMSARPEYNEKIDLMIALAPVGYVHHSTSLATVLAPLAFVPLVHHRFYAVGSEEILGLFQVMAYGLCGPTSPTVGICASLYFLVYGFDYTQTDFLQLAEFLAEGSNPISIKVLQHFAQNFVWQDFSRINEGVARNCLNYGSCHPPKYDLTKITAKIAIFYGANDKLAVPEDVELTRSELPNVVLHHRVDHTDWNHMDFVVAKDVNKFVFYPVLNVINNHFKAVCEGPPFDRSPEYVDEN